MSAVTRGLRNPFRTRVRTGVVVLLLAIIIGLFAVMVQGAFQTRGKLESLQANVRTMVELREAGAFGTGGFGGDRPVGADAFSVGTLDQIRRIPNVEHIVKIEEYIHAPQVDPSRPNAYAMIIGLQPYAPMRAIGEVDYENAEIIAGRGLGEQDVAQDVAVVGRVYAQERLGLNAASGETSLQGRMITLQSQPLRVVGIYATGNDFGDNHVFVPLETFRRIYNPGDKLSKIRVRVDSIANVAAVANDLQQLPGVDAVTAAEQQHGRLPLHRVADRIHREEQEKGNADQDCDKDKADLVPQEIAQTQDDHAHAASSSVLHGLYRAQPNALNDRIQTCQGQRKRTRPAGSRATCFDQC